MKTRNISKIWKTIELGNYSNNYELCTAVREKNYLTKIVQNFIQLSEEFQMKKEKSNIDLVALWQLYDLELPYDCEMEEVFNEVTKLGFELCPAEIGPQLILQLDRTDFYTIDTQWVVGSKPQKLFIGMKPFHVAEELNQTCVLTIVNESILPRIEPKDLTLSSCGTVTKNLKSFLGIEDRLWIFCHKK